MNSISWLAVLVFVVASLVLGGCAPRITVIDRHTVMEDEAAGEWPDFEGKVLQKSLEATPSAFQKTPSSAKKDRVHNVLNGELSR